VVCQASHSTHHPSFPSLPYPRVQPIRRIVPANDTRESGNGVPATIRILGAPCCYKNTSLLILFFYFLHAHPFACICYSSRKLLQEPRQNEGRYIGFCGRGVRSDAPAVRVQKVGRQLKWLPTRKGLRAPGVGPLKNLPGRAPGVESRTLIYRR